MASTKDYKDFIMSQLGEIGDIKCRPMMGEYILYYKNVVFGGIYDDRFLVKKVDNNRKYKMEEAIPYPKGKPMYYVEDVDNQEEIKNIVLDTYEGLKNDK